ncbi:MAG: hypothetical protein L6R38_005378 [Xanthoria sp. 2 TBL-2021]|nr:MAG: hypothetical protein L6R38_005378 [Xanthoria sp. 2 TBL-2021]
MSPKPSESEKVSFSPKFKLLRILPPTTQSNEIICELSWEMLDDPQEYEALSYTWGTTAQDQPIQIRTFLSQSPSPSQPKTDIFHVTKHLHAALLHLRQSTAPRTVWIDQLCIDQHSLDEKNAQVKLMARIYRSAKRTIVWLGELNIQDTDRIDIVVATERMNFRPVEREYSTLEDQVILKDLIGFGAQDNTDDSGRRRRKILAGLLNRSWFTRAWVYQEVVVAQRGVVLCGSLEMDMDIFINLLDGVCDLDFQEVGEAASIMYSSKGYKPMFAIREARFESRNGLSSTKKSRWLSTLWQAMGNLDATNPRDKVYAFLAFADSTDENRISPSYGKSIKSVYTDATVRSIYSVGSLDVLELAIKSAESSEDLPSWVPDFSKPLPSSPFMTHNVGSTEFHASRDSQYASRSSHTNLTTLTVRGHVLSTVASIHPRDFHNHKPSQILHDWINLPDVTAWVHSQIQPPVHENFPESSLTLQSRILRTLLAEGAGSDDKPDNLNYTDPEAILDVYYKEPLILEARNNSPKFDRAIRKTDSPSTRSLKLQLSTYRWIQKIVKIIVNKKFSISVDFNFGLAYEAVREGDVICILQGSKTPTVLRRVCDAEANHYRFVARCFVDGCMRGEPYEELGWTEENIKTFVLN